MYSRRNQNSLDIQSNFTPNYYKNQQLPNLGEPLHLQKQRYKSYHENKSEQGFYAKPTFKKSPERTKKQSIRNDFIGGIYEDLIQDMDLEQNDFKTADVK